MKIKNKVLAGIAGGIAAVGLIASPALAASTQAIDHLGTPTNAGYVHATIYWDSANSGSINGTVYDTDNDGHGPYGHAYVLYDNGVTQQIASKHVTAGKGYSGAILGNFGGGGNVIAMDVWACDGGNVDGFGAAGAGCYGRRYYNKARGYTAGSEVLTYQGTLY